MDSPQALNRHATQLLAGFPALVGLWFAMGLRSIGGPSLVGAGVVLTGLTGAAITGIGDPAWEQWVCAAALVGALLGPWNEPPSRGTLALIFAGSAACAATAMGVVLPFLMLGGTALAPEAIGEPLRFFGIVLARLSPALLGVLAALATLYARRDSGRVRAAALLTISMAVAVPAWFFTLAWATALAALVASVSGGAAWYLCVQESRAGT